MDFVNETVETLPSLCLESYAPEDRRREGRGSTTMYHLGGRALPLQNASSVGIEREGARGSTAVHQAWHRPQRFSGSLQLRENGEEREGVTVHHPQDHLVAQQAPKAMMCRTSSLRVT